MLKNQITDELNGNFVDVSNKINWNSAVNFCAYCIGKAVFFQAQCTMKLASGMTFATITDETLKPVALTSLSATLMASADRAKRGASYVYPSGEIQLIILDSNGTVTAPTQNTLVAGFWITA